MIGEIIADYQVPFVVNRRALGTLINGRYSKAPITPIDMVGAIVPARGEDLLRLPEGLRTEAVIRIFTQDLLRTAQEPSGFEADEIFYRGVFWEVQKTDNWQDQGAFWDSLATKKAQSPNVAVMYFGVGLNDVNTAIEVLELAGKLSDNKRNAAFTVVAGVDEYIFFAYPASFGAAVFTVDNFQGGFTLIDPALDIGGIDYRLYRSAQANLGAVTVGVA